MVSSISDTDGAALIASIYNISIKVLDDGTLYANISAIAEAGSGLAQRTHRSFGTAYATLCMDTSRETHHRTLPLG